MKYLPLVLLVLFFVTSPRPVWADSEIFNELTETEGPDLFVPFMGDYKLVQVNSATDDIKRSKDTIDRLVIGYKNESKKFLTLQIWYGGPDAGLRFSQPLNADSAGDANGKWSRTIEPVTDGVKYTREVSDNRYHTTEEYTFRKGEEGQIILNKVVTWRYFRDPKPIVSSTEVVLKKN